MSSLAKHVIQQPKPFRCLFVILVTALITAISLWIYQKSSSNDLSSQVKMLAEQNQTLGSENQQLTLNNQQQAKKIESHQHFVAIQKATDEQLQSQLTQLQHNVVLLNKELMFYQNITQGTSNTKLQIRELDLRKDSIQADKVNYRLVITQGKRINKPITGTVIITLSSNDGHRVINEHSLSLRHVQVLEGQIELTDNNTPNSISISLKRKKKKTLTQTFDWQLNNN